VTRVLVAGGAGFIGSHVCSALLEAGHEVTCLDNLSTGQLRNVEPFTANPRFRFVEGDAADPPSLESDLVLHLASPASPVYYRAKPLETMMANSFGTLRLLELAAASGARFVFASTSEVYGDPLEHPQRETYWGNVNPVGERACYDESKRFGETLTLEFARRGVSVAIVRIFNTYGPRMTRQDGRVIPAFIEAALDGRPFPIQGSGEQTRSFCFVSDLVEALLTVAFAPLPSGEIFNIGNPHEITVRELAAQVAAVFAVEPRYEYLPAAPDDPSRRLPDITRIKSRFGWQPRTGLEAGLKATSQHLQQLRELAGT
jgi:dTDP-glucose 4,6-dehydratase/UDP-glucuronate decarboxylase